MCTLVTWAYTLKFNRGEGWGDSCLSVRFGSASAVQMVEFLSFIPRHESRYEFPVSFLVSIKKMNKVFFSNGAESIMPHTAATDPSSPLGTLPSPSLRYRMMALLRDPDSSTFP